MMRNKYDKLIDKVQSYERVIIAFSGGVDSTFLAKVCVDTLGSGNVLACIFASPLLPQKHLKFAEKIARDINIRLITVDFDILSNVFFIANGPDRCFHCKKMLLGKIKEIASEKGYSCILCGNNKDDYNDYRPGNKAVELFEVERPLAYAGLTKEDIRQLSRDCGLITADIPSYACLATRISYQEQISRKKLKQIELAENFLAELGFSEYRVRYHNNLARIEVVSEDIDKITNLRGRILIKFKEFGFQYVAVDLEGFRSGSLNEMLSEHEKQQYL